jgi:hypothetical protein
VKVILLHLFLILVIGSFAQNTITVRKSDTTFNAFYYSEHTSTDTYSNAFQGDAKGNVVFSKKCRSYYILREDGSVSFFNEKPNYKKIKKQYNNVDWSVMNSVNGKYYISGNEILIFPYTYTETGEKVLGSQSLQGNYHLDKLVMHSGRSGRTMIKLK